MSALWGLITSNLEWLVTGLSLVFAALFGRERAKRKQAEDYIETRRRIDEARPDPGLSDDEWLRERSKR